MGCKTNNNGLLVKVCIYLADKENICFSIMQSFTTAYLRAMLDKGNLIRYEQKVIPTRGFEYARKYQESSDRRVIVAANGKS